MDRITLKQVFDNECYWGRRSWPRLGAALPLVTGKAEPDQAGALEGRSEQAWKKGAHTWPMTGGLIPVTDFIN